MFKFMIFLVCIAAIVIAAPATERELAREVIPILRSEMSKNDDGSYQLSYEGGDGTTREEKAIILNAGTEDEALEVKGSYKYISQDGEEVEVFYTAGVNGFVPYGKTINEEISAVAEAAKDLPKEEPHVKSGKNYE